jgi:hypothetical protein
MNKVAGKVTGNDFPLPGKIDADLGPFRPLRNLQKLLRKPWFLKVSVGRSTTILDQKIA